MKKAFAFFIAFWYPYTKFFVNTLKDAKLQTNIHTNIPSWKSYLHGTT